MATLDLVPSDAEEMLYERLSELPRGRRSLVAVAGPPGVGKSDLADRLTIRLNRKATNRAATLPINGFLLDNVILNSMGRLDHKGAPDTFDGGSLVTCVRRLKANIEDEVAVPVYDRNLEIARGAARLIRRTTDVIILEGSYLLCQAMPWAPLIGQFNLSVMLKADDATLSNRLDAVWRQHGLGSEERRKMIEQNDLPNARYVREHSAAADVVLAIGD